MRGPLRSVGTAVTMAVAATLAGAVAGSVQIVYGDAASSAPRPPAAPSAPSPDSSEGVDPPADPVVHDVMILYSTAAAAEAGGRAAMRARIDRVIAEANQVYENSRIDVRLRLVHADEVAKNPHPTDPTVARRGFIDDPDPAYGDVRGLRDRHRADIVSLWGKDLAYGGVAPGWTTARADASLGYHIVDAELAAETYSFLHEVGHNQGCFHDIGTDGWSDARPDYAYGWALPESRGLTIMAKGPPGYARIPHFSNPEVAFRGEPTGAVGLLTPDLAHTFSADNARRIRETARIVAAWR